MVSGPSTQTENRRGTGPEHSPSPPLPGDCGHPLSHGAWRPHDERYVADDTSQSVESMRGYTMSRTVKPSQFCRQGIWVHPAVGELLAINMGSWAVRVGSQARLLALHVSRKCPLCAGSGATVCRPLHLAAGLQGASRVASSPDAGDVLGDTFISRRVGTEVAVQSPPLPDWRA
jgi:hypothetical protein